MPAPTPITFKARLQKPATPKSAAWSFLVVPAAASAKLPTRSMIAVEGSFAGKSFKAVLEPDGQGSHWLKVPRALREAAGASVGDTVALAIAPAAKQPEPRVPPDLRKALDAAPGTREGWAGLTPVARRDWIQWIGSGKKAETRVKRIATTVDMLASGKRRVCCFDRSGIYSGAFCAPQAAEADA
jgi:hypothetical protein